MFEETLKEFAKALDFSGVVSQIKSMNSELEKINERLEALHENNLQEN